MITDNHHKETKADQKLASYIQKKTEAAQARFENTLAFLKELHREFKGHTYKSKSLTKMCKEYEIDTRMAAVLVETGILKKAGAGANTLYRWDDTMVPGTFLAEKLLAKYKEAMDLKKANKKLEKKIPSNLKRIEKPVAPAVLKELTPRAITVFQIRGQIQTVFEETSNSNMVFLDNLVKEEKLDANLLKALILEKYVVSKAIHGSLEGFYSWNGIKAPDDDDATLLAERMLEFTKQKVTPASKVAATAPDRFPEIAKIIVDLISASPDKMMKSKQINEHISQSVHKDLMKAIFPRLTNSKLDDSRLNYLLEKLKTAGYLFATGTRGWWSSEATTKTAPKAISIQISQPPQAPIVSQPFAPVPSPGLKEAAELQLQKMKDERNEILKKIYATPDWQRAQALENAITAGEASLNGLAEMDKFNGVSEKIVKEKELKEPPYSEWSEEKKKKAIYLLGLLDRPLTIKDIIAKCKTDLHSNPMSELTEGSLMSTVSRMMQSLRGVNLVKANGKLQIKA